MANPNEAGGADQDAGIPTHLFPARSTRRCRVGRRAQPTPGLTQLEVSSPTRSSEDCEYPNIYQKSDRALAIAAL